MEEQTIQSLPNEQTPLTNPPNSEKLNSMPKTNIILITVLIVTLGLLGAEAYFAFQPTQKSQTQKQNTTISPIITNQTSDNTITLPVSLKNPAVHYARLIYELNGTITTTKNNKNGIEFSTDITDNLPPLIVTQQTDVYLVDKTGKRTQKTTIADIKTGQHVSIGLVFGLFNKQWTLPYVHIRPFESPSPTSIKPK